MDNLEFRAMIIRETLDKKISRKIMLKKIEDLPAGDVVVNVEYSSLNYKDGLSASGNRGVTKNYPHTPGIDAAGVVADSNTDAFKPGEKVIVTSYDLGMNTSGGFSEYIRVPADWVVKLPEGLNTREAMIYGTAGYTAALSVDALIKDVKPDDGDILVTGATGGVGSVAIALLNHLGYSPVAVSGKNTAFDFLKRFGAKQVISREEALDQSKKPVLKTRWAGVIDTVGGDILTTAIKSTKYNGTVTCCGMVASPNLSLSVFPFILRNVRLVGIDSQSTPMSLRTQIWNKLAGEWKIQGLEEVTTEISLKELEPYFNKILSGNTKGRTVINIAA